jgi:hypothetical protein
MNVSETFGAPYVEIVDGQEISFPLMTMDEWAECCNAIRANLRQERERRLISTNRNTQADKDAMNEQVDRELITLAYACAYRTETPQGIRSTLVKSLKVAGKNDAEAAAIIAKIPPVKQQQIAKAIADPPVINGKQKGDDPKNAPAAIESGTSTPPSSESSGPELTPDA